MATESMKIIMMVGALIVASFTIAAATKTTIGLTDAEIGVITEQTTRALASVIINVASMEQGVRHFDLKKNFAYELTSTHIRLIYIGKTGTKADELGTAHSYAYKHYQKNIIENSNMAGTDRICISKRIINCKPELTICNEGEECCTIEKSPCKYIQ